MKHFNELKEKLEELPKVIKEFIKKLDKKLDKVLEQVKDRKIPKTNNLVELFFKVTFPGKIKRIYRTYEGALNKIKLDNLIWIEKNVIEYHQKNNLISWIFYSDFILSQLIKNLILMIKKRMSD